MKDNPRHWIAEKLSRRQPPLGTHEPNKPELCYQGEPPEQHGFTPELELDLLKPYIVFLEGEIK